MCSIFQRRKLGAELTSENLAVAIRQALATKTLRVKAAEVGMNIRSEAGSVSKAVKYNEKIL